MVMWFCMLHVLWINLFFVFVLCPREAGVMPVEGITSVYVFF